MEAVPTIDLDEGPDAVARAIDEACRQWGFFQIVGHGLTIEDLDAVRAETRRFFALPLDRKREIERTDRNVWGFFDRELTKNRPDWKEILDIGPPEHSGPLAGAAPQWPEGLPGFRETLEAHAERCRRLCLGLLERIAASLGVAPTQLSSAFTPRHTSFLRLNDYPPCADPVPPTSPTVPASGRLGISHHTDAGALTLVLQDGRSGLQVEHEGQWFTIPVDPEALVVNIGDIVQVWSNDRYRAPLHRVVVDPEQARLSVAYFFNPSYETHYAPLVGDPRYRPISWGEFRAGRAAGDYADHGVEIQIGHFRIGSTVG